MMFVMLVILVTDRALLPVLVERGVVLQGPRWATRPLSHPIGAPMRIPQQQRTGGALSRGHSPAPGTSAMHKSGAQCEKRKESVSPPPERERDIPPKLPSCVYDPLLHCHYRIGEYLGKVRRAPKTPNFARVFLTTVVRSTVVEIERVSGKCPKRPNDKDDIGRSGRTRSCKAGGGGG
uniref:Secreted protein n=2 Tax=Plectus sambesii TaxID=2011161 RepID=A0A914UQI2_9BILA